MALLAGATQASAITLDLVDSFDKANTGAFGLAWDGSNIWYSNGSGHVYEMTSSGVNTGKNFQLEYGSITELAWDGTHLVQANSNTVNFYDTATGTKASSLTLGAGVAGGGSCGGTVDGLDFDHGEIWCSPDVSVIYRISGDGQSNIGAQPVIGGAGGYSGVERIEATNGTNYIVVVNDAFQPRKLCVHAMDYSEIGCQQFQNARYEGLAFDGRYVYAADYYGDRIDKYDILGDDGGSIIDPDDDDGNGGTVVPLPAAGWLLISAIAGTVGLSRRRRSAA